MAAKPTALALLALQELLVPLQQLPFAVEQFALALQRLVVVVTASAEASRIVVRHC